MARGALLTLVEACLISAAALIPASALLVHQAPSSSIGPPGEGEGEGEPVSLSRRGSPEGWVKHREEGTRNYYDIHIPRTAGTSFANDVKNLVPSNEGYFSSEFCYSHNENQFNATTDVKLAMFRDPVAHVYSQFMECKHDPWFVRKRHRYTTDAFDNVTNWLRHFDGGRNKSDFGCYHPFNLQTRAMSCKYIYKAEGAHHYNQEIWIGVATENVEKLFFVGLAERYQESLCLFYAKTHAGKRLPHFCDCTSATAWKSFKTSHKLHHVPRHKSSDLSPTDVQLINNLTELDRNLHFAVERRFMRDIEEAQNRTGVKILC